MNGSSSRDIDLESRLDSLTIFGSGFSVFHFVDVKRATVQ